MHTISKSIKIAGIAGLLGVFFLVNTAAAQVNYQSFTPRNDAETIAYLQGIIAQLLAELQARGQYTGGTHYVNTTNTTGRVLGTSYNPYDDGYVDVGTGLVRHSDNDFSFYGEIDLNDASYADVWFEYGDDFDVDEQTSRQRVTRDGTFSEDIDEDEFDDDDWNYYRAVAESPNGYRDYGVLRSWKSNASDRDRDRDDDCCDRDDDDEPVAETESAYDIEEDEAVVEGGIDMNDFDDGLVFFVYGEDEGQVEDIEDDYDAYDDIDEDGDDLEKVQVDSSLDGIRDYWRRITGLNDDTEYFFQICVEYEDEDGDETLECGGVEDFETD